MFTKERHEKIIELLNERNSVTVSELEKLFDVSLETIRRDLLALESRKELIRVHGGALSIKHNLQSRKFEVRHSEYRNEKHEIAVCASAFISEGDTIAIDSGSTAVFLCEYLAKSFKRLTVIVNSIMLFNILKQNRDFNVILCGGEYYEDDQSFFGMITLNTINNLHASKVFLAPYGVSLKFGLTSFSESSASLQRAYAEISDKIFIIADSSKFETSATFRALELNDDMTLISDSSLADDIFELYKNADIDVLRGVEGNVKG